MMTIGAFVFILVSMIVQERRQDCLDTETQVLLGDIDARRSGQSHDEEDILLSLAILHGHSLLSHSNRRWNMLEKVRNFITND